MKTLYILRLIISTIIFSLSIGVISCNCSRTKAPKGPLESSLIYLKEKNWDEFVKYYDVNSNQKQKLLDEWQSRLENKSIVDYSIDNPDLPEDNKNAHITYTLTFSDGTKEMFSAFLEKGENETWRIKRENEFFGGYW